MDHLSSCYFCGIALDTPLQTYRVSGSTPESGLAVTLCVTCHQKLDMILDATDTGATEAISADEPSITTDVVSEQSAADDNQEELSTEIIDDSSEEPSTENTDSLSDDSSEELSTETADPLSDDAHEEAQTAVTDDEEAGDDATVEAAEQSHDESTSEEIDGDPRDHLIDLDIDDNPTVIDPETPADSPFSSTIQDDDPGVIDVPDALAAAAEELQSGDEPDTRFEAEVPDIGVENGERTESPSGDEERDTSTGDEERDTSTGDEEKDTSTGDEEKDTSTGDEEKDTSTGDEEAITEPAGDASSEDPTSESESVGEEVDASGRTAVTDEVDTSERTESTEETDEETAESDVPTAGDGTDASETAERSDASETAERSDDSETAERSDASETAERSDDSETAEGENETGSQTPRANITAREYNKVIRLLQNREFPVNRNEIETVAASAYDISEADCATVIDFAIERGVLTEKRGKLFRSE